MAQAAGGGLKGGGGRLLVAPSSVAPDGGLLGCCSPQGMVTKRMGLRGWPPREWGLRG